MDFWEKSQPKADEPLVQKKPIFALAPMDGVTDTVFRQIVASCGKPDIFFTEFVPIDALFSKDRTRILQDLKFTEKERPIVAQIWGTDPEKFYKTAQMISKMGFDGIDINMGCPDKSAMKKGGCGALINNPKLAQEIILSTIKGANGLPVSIKTRIGFYKIETTKWLKVLLNTPISALILHLRTVKEMSKVPAHWDEIRKVVKLRDKLKSEALIIGNGDVKSLKEAKEKCKKYKIDGVMIGRAIFENVYLFNENIDPEKVTPNQKIALLLKHLKLFQKTYGNNKHFALMKKFVKCYLNNFKDASSIREKLMQTNSLKQLCAIFQK